MKIVRLEKRHHLLLIPQTPLTSAHTKWLSPQNNQSYNLIGHPKSLFPITRQSGSLPCLVTRYCTYVWKFCISNPNPVLLKTLNRGKRVSMRGKKTPWAQADTILPASSRHSPYLCTTQKGDSATSVVAKPPGATNMAVFDNTTTMVETGTKDCSRWGRAWYIWEKSTSVLNHLIINVIKFILHTLIPDHKHHKKQPSHVPLNRILLHSS